jgi:hypothetical protein
MASRSVLGLLRMKGSRRDQQHSHQRDHHDLGLNHQIGDTKLAVAG